VVDDGTQQSSSSVSDALALESIEFSKAVSEAAHEERTQIATMENKMSAQGMALSGPRLVREAEIRSNSVAVVIDRAIAKRKQLGNRFPELLTPDQLFQLRQKLDRHLHIFVQSQDNYLARYSWAAGVLSFAWNQIVEETAGRLRGKIANDVETLRLEARLGIHNASREMTINISNSTIAALNLGTVMGDLTASVQNLNNHGQQELARLIQSIAESLVASTELQQIQRKELLEHLSVVSTEVALSPENRKMGPLKSSVTLLREGLAGVAQLSALWSSVEHILKTTGILP
jgi:hypothetical protein